ncbi:acyl transferase domain-containing protein [Kitasatospora sp. MAA19]|uniref:type I polyketide synthase n=1 Tax=Kitasatospora sp. MAA19 TaxID=3035090 RepID=UPI002473B399|nr:type I polyketide synthase [Kitasatospora sp. MAA19]MDH6707259.1 acyl transferase domain-containing protein [Kitasatospora sp. MAA19]
MERDPAEADGTTGLEIAVIGLACRFPGASGPEQYWENLRTGTESITFFSPGELAAAGVPEALRTDPDYVAAQGVLADADLFDADFFGVSPKEADLMDPQHRVLLRCAWEALEDSGHDPRSVPGQVGVYAGSYYNSYVDHVDARIDATDPGEVFARNVANEKDFLATRIAYKLDLSGPALTVQSACSTSLVAVHLAGQALLSGACDLALAGGATVRAHQRQGYLLQPGGIFSADGHCRPFDATAQGTVAANGAGMVVLKRLEDALADGDPIRAVIRGSAVGNDGAERIGFTAPGVAGQARVIRAALTMAEVDPATVSYVEAHGSGTPLGDPIEVEALTQVFQGLAPGSCAIGAVKGNIGHTHAAAGVAGLIKTVLALQHRQIPPSLHFDVANPAIDFTAVPFRVNTRLTDWRGDGGPRRAGVSSFGMGGTNAHVVLEEAPAPERRPTGRARRLLPLSARTATALETATDRLADRLDRPAERSGGGAPDLAGVARTLQTGRRHFGHRRFVIAEDAAETARALRERDPRAVRGGQHDGSPRKVALVFPGLGEQRVGMGREVHAGDPVFRRELDRCAEGFRAHLGVDLRDLLYPADAPDGGTGGPDLRRMLRRGTADGPRGELDRTLYAQPATFAVEYALARLWESWGIRPTALAGYSIGEYVAAHLAGVLSLDDALLLVAHRARLIEGLPGGAMLAVPLPEERVLGLLDEHLSLAAVNGPALCVVAGTGEAVGALAARLGEEGIAARPLRTTHAFHSHLMDPIAAEFAELAAGVTLHPPRIPYISNVTGDWADAGLVTDPGYWVRHLRLPVRFADGVRRLWEDPGRVLLETGPGQSLTSLALQLRPPSAAAGVAVASLPGEFDRQPEERFLLGAAGRLWVAGVDLDWSAVSGGNDAPRVALPTYPFEESRHWIDPAPRTPARPAPSLAKKADLADWFHTPVWESAPPRPVPGGTDQPRSWLLFVDDEGVGEALAARLAADGHRAVTVRAGTGWRELPDGCYEIAPGSLADHQRLVARIGPDGGLPDRVVHLWSVGPRRSAAQTLERGFHSLLWLNRAAADHAPGAPLDISVVSSDAFAVLGTEPVAPEKATVTGPCLVLPLEQPGTLCRAVDLSLPVGRSWSPADGEQLYEELLDPSSGPLTALRGRRRWRRAHRPVRVEDAPGARTPLREGGVYLITGGFGGIGLSLARHFATAARARLVLVGRSPLPPREDWAGLLADSPAPGEPAPPGRTVERIRAVLELERLGAQVLAAAADVADSAAMHRVADQALERFGSVDGIVHAAGVPAAGLAQLKTAEAAARVLDPKVHGGLVVDALARRLSPDFTVHCSSSLALTGGVGQVDYVAANAFLDALAQHAEATGGPYTVSVDWDGWQEVGMAVRTVGAADPGDADGNRTGPVDHPLLDACLRDDESAAVYSVSLAVATSWLIDEHRMAGNAVVPGTGHLELARAVHEHQSGDARAVLSEVTFLSPVVVGEDQRRELRVVLEKRHTPARFAVVSRPADAAGDGRAEEEGWQVHVTGAVGPVPDGTAPPRRHDIAELIAAAGMRDLGAVTHTGPMGFGPRSRCLRRVHLGETEALAELELPEEFAADLERIALHPSLLDLGAGFHGMNLAEEFRIPLGYGSLTLLAPLPRRVVSHHRFRAADRRGKETFTADFTLMDASGQEVARVEDFVLKRVTDLETRLTALRDGTSSEVAAYRFPPAAARRGGPGPLREHLDQGIRPEEGVEALLRLLGAGLGPQVAVVAKDLDAVFADIHRHRVGAPPDGRSDDPSGGPQAGAAAAHGVHPRPGVSTAYAEPGDETEAALTALWAELLGLERVGVHDDFFELGGHSLLGLQLSARIRRRFGVHLPLNTLFESLTVAELAAALRKRPGTTPDGATPDGTPSDTTPNDDTTQSDTTPSDTTPDDGTEKRSTAHV